MFEIIMLLGFLYAATSQMRSDKADNSKEDSESPLLPAKPRTAKPARHHQRRACRLSRYQSGNYMNAA